MAMKPSLLQLATDLAARSAVHTGEPTVKELTDTIDVVVASRHIAAGEKDEPTACAVYLALTEDGYTDVYVDREWVDFGEVRYLVPPELTNWLNRFDSGEVVEPERFRLSRDLETCFKELELVPLPNGELAWLRPEKAAVPA